MADLKELFPCLGEPQQVSGACIDVCINDCGVISMVFSQSLKGVTMSDMEAINLAAALMSAVNENMTP